MANTLKFGNGEWYGKKDTILAYNDENNNYKPLPFDFSRGSSATVVNKDGLIETVGSGEPRIDYKDNSKGALLLEPSRTNLITQSESFSNSYWAKARLTATSNSVISPDGTLNASKIFGDGSNSWKYINRNGFSLINQNYYTFSVFAKADTLNYVQLILSGATAENYQNFDLLNGVIGSGSNVFDAKIETFVNGWYKCSMTVLATSTATTDLFIDLADSSTMSRAGSFLTSGGIYIYGAQLEQGSYATSYIPTSGSVVTRLVDSLMLKSFQNTILNNGVSPFALFLDLQNYKLESNGNTGLNFYDESINYNTEGRAYLYNTSAGFGQGWNDNPVPFTNNSSVKLLWNYTSSTEGYIFSNGTKGGLNSGTATSGFDYLDLKGEFNTLLINQILIYNTALTDQEAIALTTI